MKFSDPLLSEKEIRELVDRLGGEINKFYADRKEETPVLVLGVLNGAFIFLADLVRKLTFPLEVEFIRAASYGTNTVSSGEVRILSEPSIPLDGRDILLVDELIDTGRTLDTVVRYCQAQGARSVHSAVLLDKVERRKESYRPEFIGKPVKNVFLAGYGLDGGAFYRRFPLIYAVLPEETKKP